MKSKSVCGLRQTRCGRIQAYLRLQIGIIDARNGEVLLYTDPIFPGDPTTAVDRLQKALEKGFKKLPNLKADFSY
jgi:hypothetical protein